MFINLAAKKELLVLGWLARKTYIAANSLAVRKLETDKKYLTI
jgi:hypothetical protein